MTEKYEHINVSTEDRVCSVTLNRPEVHNAFNRRLIEELTDAFQDISQRAPGEVRAVVLAGAGKSFCAGADVNWMRESLNYSEAENIADAMHMARMFDTIDRCPALIIGRIHGAALGGGVGLTAVCDIAIAAEGAQFAFSEAKLGIAPAVISPFVIRKVGVGHARALFLTAERFGADRALRVGLIHAVKPVEELDGEVGRLLGEIQSSAPGAVARAKSLISTVPQLSHDEAMQYTAETIAALRVGAEGQEGLRAFLEKRRAEWA